MQGSSGPLHKTPAHGYCELKSSNAVGNRGEKCAGVCAEVCAGVLQGWVGVLSWGVQGLQG